jgi:hypothetical protein
MESACTPMCIYDNISLNSQNDMFQTDFVDEIKDAFNISRKSCNL